MQVEYNLNFIKLAGLQEKYNASIKLGGLVMETPDIDDEYWFMRVKLSEKQAIVCFPKFNTIGIGFQIEEDWNTNLPYIDTAEEIYNHIEVNKGDNSISKEDCIQAIELIQKECNKFVKQWTVPSQTSNDKTYKVSLTLGGEYRCSCPRWAFHREECKHIVAVKNGDYDDNETPFNFSIIPANVGEVKILKVENGITEIGVPLIPFSEEGTSILATMIYDLIKMGVSWKDIKNRYERVIPKSWHKQEVINYVEHRGRFVYTRFEQGRGWIDGAYLPILMESEQCK